MMAMIRHFNAHHMFLKEGYSPKKAAKDIMENEEALAKEKIVQQMMGQNSEGSSEHKTIYDITVSGTSAPKLQQERQ